MDGYGDGAKIEGSFELLRIVGSHVSDPRDFNFALSLFVLALVINCTIRIVLLGFQHLLLRIAKRIVHQTTVAPVVLLRTIN